MDQRKDPSRVLEVINALDADVVVLQEADHRLGRRPAALSRDLIESDSDFSVVPLAQSAVSLGWHGNAVLVREKGAVTSVSHIGLPGLEPRGAVHVTLSGPVPMGIVATHLGLRRKDRRAQQFAICSALPDDLPVLVAGDFNEWSKRDGLEPFEERFEVHVPGQSFPAGFAVAPLDRFASSPEIQVGSMGVSKVPGANLASDHLPIWCDASLAKHPVDAAPSC